MCRFEFPASVNKCRMLRFCPERWNLGRPLSGQKRSIRGSLSIPRCAGWAAPEMLFQGQGIPRGVFSPLGQGIPRGAFSNLWPRSTFRFWGTSASLCLHVISSFFLHFLHFISSLFLRFLYFISSFFFILFVLFLHVFFMFLHFSSFLGPTI